jgi:hypothetical protein
LIRFGSIYIYLVHCYIIQQYNVVYIEYYRSFSKIICFDMSSLIYQCIITIYECSNTLIYTKRNPLQPIKNSGSPPQKTPKCDVPFCIYECIVYKKRVYYNTKTEFSSKFSVKSLNLPYRKLNKVSDVSFSVIH